MPPTLRQPVARSLGLVAAAALGIAACGPAAVSGPSAARQSVTTSAPSGSTGLTTTTTFGVPFSLALPTGWKVGIEEADMFAAYLATGDNLEVGVDVQLVPKVHADPCNTEAGTDDGGASAGDLASWMIKYVPLAGTAGAPSTIGGSDALVVDEAFAGTPCQNPELWPTSGGWLDATEHKRYFVFEVAGKRLVATIVSTDAGFAANVDVGLAVLGTVTFDR